MGRKAAVKPGKLPHKLLAKLLEGFPADDPRVVVGPRVGEDAAVIAFGDQLLVAKTDPITFATDLIGWYAVHVNANDIACMGGTPRWFLATLLLPEGATQKEVTSIFAQLGEACRELGVTLVGGHTEITLGIDRPILIGCMLGEVMQEKLVSSGGAQPGDMLILSGPIAIEGTALLAREAGEALRAKGVSEEVIGRARELLFTPGLSVVGAARAALGAGGVTALHDPTEGGLATGLRELSVASGVGLEVEARAIPVLPETREVAAALGLEAMGLIASGSLLIAAEPSAAEGIVEALRAAGQQAAIIGRTLDEGEACWLVSGEGHLQPLPELERDEVARFLEG
jgi:hydrogenase expression/formation protein HypE